MQASFISKAPTFKLPYKKINSSLLYTGSYTHVVSLNEDDLHNYVTPFCICKPKEVCGYCEKSACFCYEIGRVVIHNDLLTEE